MKERKQQTLYISRKDTEPSSNRLEMNEHSQPETVFTTFEFSGVCNLKVSEFLLINNVGRAV